MIVDTHCHVSDRWYEPAEVLLGQMDRVGVDCAWLVQILGEYDNRYQQEACRNYPERFLSVVGIDWTQPDAIDEFIKLVAEGARGLRLRPGSRSPGEDPLAIWREAGAQNVVVSCVGAAAQFSAPDFAEVIAACPGLPIVLEHLGGLARPDVGDAAAAAPSIAALAQHPNLYLKVPGLGQMMPRTTLGQAPGSPAFARDTPLAAMLGAFGPHRLMWGSDFPVVSTREGYENSLNWLRSVLPVELAGAICGGTAQLLAATIAKPI